MKSTKQKVQRHLQHSTSISMLARQAPPDVRMYRQHVFGELKLGGYVRVTVETQSRREILDGIVEYITYSRNWFCVRSTYGYCECFPILAADSMRKEVVL